MHATNKEDIDRQAKSIEQSSQATRQDVHRVYEKKRLYGKRRSNRRRESRGSAAEQQHTDRTCTSCGLMHGVSRQCPAKGKKCLNCSKTGHFARMCRGPKTRPRQYPKQEWPNRPRDKLKTYYMEEGEPNAVRTQQSKQDSSSDSDFVFQTKTNSGRKRILPTVGVKINDVKGQVEADSCSTVNIIDEEKFQRLQSSSTNKLKLTPTNTEVYPYGQGKPLPLIGCFETEIESLSTGNKMTASFLVVKGSTNSRPLISLETSIELGVLMITNTMQTPSTSTAQPLLESMTFNQSQSASVDQASPKPNDAISGHLLDTYTDVFSGLGKHKKMKARLVVDESVAPVIHKQRKIPYNLREKARKEEQRLMEMGIIEAVPGDQPTTWCTNPVIASKPHNPDAIRYCSDMRDPNTAIKRPITEVPTVTDIKFKLEGAKVFSVLDMNEGYHQLELEENSHHLTTFYGSRKKMRHTRLNYGTISAQDIFDKTMDDTIEGLDGVLHIRDDFIVYGKNNQEHDDALEAFLQRFRECGLTLNPKKCKFRVPEIEFYGLQFSANGVKPAPAKVEALQKMSPPKNATEVRSLLGMAQYSAQFIPRFAEITAPLRMLTHKNMKWKWTREEQKSFEALQSALSDESVLGYYEVGSETKLKVDAGPNGLGLILLQKKERNEWKPIECSSRSLTETEKRYSQLEKEALAIRWACERCYVYLIGSNFIVETDHKPLVPLFNNPNSRPPLRIERWLLYLQQFQFTLRYCPGSENAADYLSRHAIPVASDQEKDSKRRNDIVHQIIVNTIPKSITLEEMQEATAIDLELGKLAQYIQEGKARECKQDPLTSQFNGVFSELSFIDGLILRGSRIVVPQQLRRRVLDICHEGHLGVVKSKQLLRSKVWFPGIDKSIEDMISNCLPCQACTRKTVREPLQTSSLPKGPWVEVSADICGPFPTGEYVLVALDAYSRYPEIEIVKTINTATITFALERIFATHGIPEEIKTDNGAPFQGKEFAEFSKEKGFFHRRVTPLWPEANGQVENFMKNIGKVAKTAHISGKNWRKELYVFLSNYRAAPHISTKKPPYELLMNRRVRTKIPERIPIQSRPDVSTNDEKAKRKMKQYADKSRKVESHDLQKGDTVLVKQKKKNKFSSVYEPNPYVVEKIKGSMITAVRETDGRSITRNNSHYKRVNKSRNNRLEQDLWNFEARDCTSRNPQDEPSHDVESALRSEPLLNPEQLELRRSRRIIRKPAWTQDYVVY